LTAVLTALFLGAVAACSSDDGQGPSGDGTKGVEAGAVDGAGDGAGGGVDGPDDGDGGARVVDGPAGADTSSPDGPCVPQSSTLAIVGPSGGSACSFAFSKSYTPGLINLVLTPGWGTVCHAGSSQNCGSGASADGWWFSGGEIHLCDATCSRFYKQTIAGKLTVQLGCPTENCTH
jgi:hypothetical protein